jgi:cytochrome c oxidase cbb3-type subunit 3
MAGMTREKLVSTIRDGVAGTSMPAWKSVFEDRDIHAVAAYISRVFHSVSR